MNLETTITPSKNLNGAALKPISATDVEQAASNLTTDVYKYLTAQSREIAGRVVQFAKKNPAVTTAAVITLGLVAARMLSRPSQDRRESKNSSHAHR